MSTTTNERRGSTTARSASVKSGSAGSKPVPPLKPTTGKTITFTGPELLAPIEQEPEACAHLGISKSEYDELTEVFRLVDIDGGGTISKDELELLMRTLGIRATKEEMDTMVNEIVNDLEKDEIDLESFIDAMSRKVTTSLPQDTLIKAFQVFDEDNSGRVKTSALFDLLMNLGSPDRTMKQDDVEDLLNSLTPQALSSGLFDYANFVGMLFSS